MNGWRKLCTNILQDKTCTDNRREKTIGRALLFAKRQQEIKRWGNCRVCAETLKAPWCSDMHIEGCEAGGSVGQVTHERLWRLCGIEEECHCPSLTAPVRTGDTGQGGEAYECPQGLAPATLTTDVYCVHSLQRAHQCFLTCFQTQFTAVNSHTIFNSLTSAYLHSVYIQSWTIQELSRTQSPDCSQYSGFGRPLKDAQNLCISLKKQNKSTRYGELLGFWWCKAKSAVLNTNYMEQLATC